MGGKTSSVCACFQNARATVGLADLMLACVRTGRDDAPCIIEQAARMLAFGDVRVLTPNPLTTAFDDDTARTRPLTATSVLPPAHSC